MFGSFRLWFDSLTLQQKRAVIRERLVTYLSDPMADDFINACPPEVRDAVIAFRALVHHSDWSVKQ